LMAKIGLGLRGGLGVGLNMITLLELWSCHDSLLDENKVTAVRGLADRDSRGR